MEIQELKNEIIREIEQTEDVALLKYILRFLDNAGSGSKQIDIFKHVERVMKEEENLFKRLADS